MREGSQSGRRAGLRLRWRGSVVRQARRAIPIYLLVLALVALTLMVSPTFRTVQNFRNVVAQVTPLAAVAVGQTLVLLMGGIDLSIGSVVSLTTVILSFSGRNGAYSLGPALLLALGAGALAGLLNGLGIVRLRIPPLLMTLASSAVVKGVALYLRDAPGGSVDRGLTRFLNWNAGPVSTFGLILLVLYLAAWAFLSFTRPGRHLYATGGDMEHARRSGVNVDRTTIMGYTLAGVVGAIGGILLAGRIYSGDPVIGDPYSMDSIASAVLGGTSLLGGIGGVVGTLAGAVLLAMTNNILNLLNVFSFYQYIVKGLILAGALVLYHVRGRGAHHAG